MLHLPTTIEAIFGAVLVLGLNEGHENRFPVRGLPATLYCLHTSRLTEDGACNVTSVLSAFPCLPELPTLPPKCRYFDRKPPVISGCPENQTLQVELGLTSLKVDWTEPSVADHCETVTLTSKTHVPGDMFPVGETLVMYTFSDSCMNDSHVICQFSINIVTEDTTPPVISGCPANQRLELDLGKMSTIAIWNEPSATDISGTTRIQSRSHVPGEQFDLGRTSVTYLFSDDSGNTATCQFHITVMNPVDRAPPVISGCPENQTLPIELGQTSVKVDWTEPSVTDHSKTVTLTSRTHVPGDMFAVGETLVMYIFSDPSMNDAICQFSINIVTEDTTPPVISSCPANQSLELDVGKMSTTVLWNEPSATDISGTTRIQSRSHVPGDQFDLGRTNVTYLFSDDSGNTATCQFHITIMNPASSDNSVVISTVTLATSIAILALLWWCKKRKVRQEKQPSALPGLELSQQGVVLQTYNIKN